MKKIVVIGGGTGNNTVLRGLKKYDVDLKSIVSMFDNGGSTGILRDEFGILPPGDVRQCLVALSDDSNQILRKLFNYRFVQGDGLNGHNFGNLFLTALSDITGSEYNAIKEAGIILGVRGRVLPVSLDNCHLYASLEDGTLIEGEKNISNPIKNLNIKKIFLKPEANIFNKTKEAILNADLIVIGPGGLYYSVVPNLIVNGVVEAIKESKAKKVYVCNVMTKSGETTNFKVSDHVNAIENYLGKDVIDYVIINDKKLSFEMIEKYKEENAEQVIIDIENLIGDYKIILADTCSETLFARHDPNKLAKIIMDIYEYI